MAGRRVLVLGVVLVVAGAAVIAAAGTLSPGPGPQSGQARPWGPIVASGPAPGSPGFVAGTPSSPRIVRIVASGALRFYPDAATVQRGETVTFEVTTVGMASHEFMVGPAADVAGDVEGTPEIADTGMTQTKSLTYTFGGTGPFAFACHAPGHYEAGMRGTIAIIG